MRDCMLTDPQMLTSPRQKPERTVTLFETLPPEVMMMVFTGVEDIFDLACLALSCKTMALFAVAYDWLIYPCKAIEKPGFNVFRQLNMLFHLPDNDENYDPVYCFLERLHRGWIDLDKNKWCLNCMNFQPKSKQYWFTKQAESSVVTLGMLATHGVTPLRRNGLHQSCNSGSMMTMVAMTRRRFALRVSS